MWRKRRATWTTFIRMLTQALCTQCRLSSAPGASSSLGMDTSRIIRSGRIMGRMMWTRMGEKSTKKHKKHAASKKFKHKHKCHSATRHLPWLLQLSAPQGFQNKGKHTRCALPAMQAVTELHQHMVCVCRVDPGKVKGGKIRNCTQGKCQ